MTPEIIKADKLTFVFKFKKSFAYKLSATLMFIFCISMIQPYLLGGIIMSLISLFFAVQAEGIELDLIQLKYRYVRIIGNLSFGNWKNLPQIKYISVFRTILASSIMGRSGATITNREKTILINLVYGKNQRLLVYKTENINDAFAKAKYFSEKLNVRIFDATNKKGKWMEQQNEA